MIDHYRDLHVVVLDPDMHKRTCGYWYLVGALSTPHTAFATKAGLLKWLDERGLRLASPSTLTDPGEWHYQNLIGEYQTEMHYTPDEVSAFHALAPVVETRTLSNGEYTLAKVTVDPDGIRTVHTLNPNIHTRRVFDYFESKSIMDGAPLKFKLTIKLGNDAMRTRADLARARLQVAEGMGAAADEDDEIEEGRDEIGYVRDLNGNRVGEWILGEWTEGEED